MIALIACTRPPPDHGTTAPKDADTDSDADADADADADSDADTDTDTTTTTTTTATTTTTTTTMPTVIRVVTWNVEYLGVPGSIEYDAVVDVLARIDADVVALNEIDGYEVGYVATLANDLGYTSSLVPADNPFGWIRNAVMTRLPVTSSTVWTSADLSLDPAANDMTRLPVAVEVQTAGGTLAVVSEHWKSGFGVIDEFRRVVESERVGQAVLAATTTAVLALGDMNAEIGEIGIVPTWFYVPVDAPSSFALGADLQTRLDNGGIPNDVFIPLTNIGLARVPALQRDGNPATRDVSGRIIDHIFASGDVTVIGAEIYDARDDGLPGLPLAGTAPATAATEDASDHFPVFVDLTVGM